MSVLLEKVNADAGRWSEPARAPIMATKAFVAPAHVGVNTSACPVVVVGSAGAYAAGGEVQ